MKNETTDRRCRQPSVFNLKFMIKEINKGEQFLCIKDFFMEDGEQSYTEGEIYTSDVTGSIEDNQSDSHYFLDDDI